MRTLIPHLDDERPHLATGKSRQLVQGRQQRGYDIGTVTLAHAKSVSLICGVRACAAAAAKLE
eukprot:scaffold1298_cov98-Isochrysis_galbana.AAC.3